MTYKDKIILKGMGFYGHHGWLPAEQDLGQWFEMDLELTLDLSAAGESDDLEKSLSYAEVYDKIKALAEGPSFSLIEALAAGVIKICFEFEQVQRAKVVLKKPQVPLGGPLDYAAVEMERSRGDR